MKTFKLAVGAALTLAAFGAAAQNYPAKPVTFISNISGAPETILRNIFDRVKQNTGATFIYENRAGAAGGLSLQGVKRAAPDGYTMGMTYSSALTLTPLTNADIGVDALKDFVPISNLFSIASLFATGDNLQAKDMRDVVAAAKAKPGAVRVGIVSPTTRVYVVMLEELTGAKFLQVPFKNSNDAAAALLGGHIDLYADGYASIMSHGKLKPMSYGGSSRLPAAGNVPTMREMYGFDMMSWTGALAPTGTPATAINFAQRELVRVVKAPDMAPTLEKAGLGVIGDTPEEFGKTLRAEVESFRDVLRKYPDIR